MNSVQSTSNNDREQLKRASPKRMAFSVQETAEQLGVCPASVYRALKRGELEAVMLGGRRLIPRSSIDKLLTEVKRLGPMRSSTSDDYADQCTDNGT